MPGLPPDPGAPLISGIGVATGFGFGKDSLRRGLYGGENAFDRLRRPGRQCPEGSGAGAPFIGVELPEVPALLAPRVARSAGLGAQVAVAVLDEAWREAGLAALEPERIGLIVGGANLQSREQMLARQAYAERLAFLPPRHGYGFFDTDLAAVCCGHFPIRGFAHTLGGASASGTLAVLEAVAAVKSGRVDACIALGALQDVSMFDLQGMRALGALGSERYAGQPGLACRPFDRDRDGFIYGESSAALVIQRSDSVPAGQGYAAVAGGAQLVDGERGTNPSAAGQRRVLAAALAQAGLAPEQIDYINAHATGTPRGDDTELELYRQAGLAGAWINASKSLIGHGLSAAGAVETAAVALQMRDGRLHATRNLDNPLDPALRWVRGEPREQAVRHALKLSFGFGGINTALALRVPGERG
ncbi:beta-ketoacyl synthase N-terminal-like domain-containing protein [Alkalilimnicola sp. S0819]|uniref:beta-ketoacyl synthase N-terminal-like domain-containing protein n=1 Tax=Alkalilimnicola sp. S0819 TaxID=2613922 RepID=UPI001261F1B4|nr:beta-ketoacyl synthase N-terminal-like domain-containing protein [Alkalilimnicola sp. S0819]KAB7619599.1 polyketide beta-ketoacyl:ACP synthase [Alkalilimnicola sp. S0819]MPQ17603.1 polyketide beta-ketoacyl:ACP synthase [Alkalilimnicola sp. S0819]